MLVPVAAVAVFDDDEVVVVVVEEDDDSGTTLQLASWTLVKRPCVFLTNISSIFCYCMKKIPKKKKEISFVKNFVVRFTAGRGKILGKQSFKFFFH